MLSEEGLATIAEYAQGIGVHKELIPGWSAADVQPAQGQTLVETAHEQGLLVHGWTYRAENVFLPCRLRRGDAAAAEYMRQPGDFEAELELHFSLGVDGIFTDFPDLARSFRDEHTAARRRSSVA
ncbi:MAG: glycerophosphodiester phosphodiesterase family protein, partial [Dehalococcoidia bacterium]